MTEILLIRHGEAGINVERKAGDKPAIGHKESSLTLRGIEQSVSLHTALLDEWGGLSFGGFYQEVGVSTFSRPQQTARFAGFGNLKIMPQLDELDLPLDLISGRKAIAKHAREMWTPDDGGTSREFIDGIRSGKNKLSIFFTHGLRIAKIMMELADEVGLNDFPHQFHPKRGFIPLQTQVVKLKL